jgi:hypothetical protein
MSQGANAKSPVSMRVSKGIPHLIDQLSDFFSLRF